MIALLKSLLSFLFLSTALLLCASTQASSNESNLVLPQQQLIILHERISDLEVEIKNLNRRINEEKLVVNKETLLQRRNEKQQTLITLKKNFEDLATGHANIEIFNDRKNNFFNFNSELRKIFSPLLRKLKSLTERSRSIDLLESENQLLEKQVKESQAGIEKIIALKNEASDQRLLTHLEQLHQVWENRKHDAQNQINFNTLKIFELENETQQNERPDLSGFIQDFFYEHIKNLIAVLAICIVLFVSIKFTGNRLARVAWLKHNAKSRRHSRIISIAFDAVAIAMTAIVALIYLFLVNDWLLLALLIFMLAGLIFSMKDSLPTYLNEARYLLNYGSAREGERVIYNGVPWKISRVNYYSTLINPLLSGGRIRLPLSEMTHQISRRWSESEPWFPTRRGDVVLLADGTFGEVSIQTPEQVVIKQWDKQNVYYQTNNFIDQHPTNLSNGFSLFVTFGLDYALQSDIIDSIPGYFTEQFNQMLRSQGFADDFEKIQIEFNEASSSSLDVIFIMSFQGKSAASYFAIKRFCQKVAVATCNKHSWTIPFEQLTVSLSSNGT